MNYSTYHIVIIPEDHVIIMSDENRKNEKPLIFDFKTDFYDITDVSAIQWFGEDYGSNYYGQIEYIRAKRPTQLLQKEEYEKYIAPYVELYLQESDRLKAEEEKRKAEEEEKRKKEEEEYNSEEARFARLRAKRDQLLQETDCYMLSDFPVTESNKAKVIAYREALRALPEQEGAPWTDDTIPWPTLELD